jgi:hypothetical protein
MLLDEAGRRGRPHCVGEITIKGRYMSSGVLAQTRLTEKVFRPASDGSGEQIYRTGDLGSQTRGWLPRTCGTKRISESSFVAWGSNWKKLKLCYSEHPLSRIAVAEVRPDGLGDNRLITYIVAPRGQKPTAS